MMVKLLTVATFVSFGFCSIENEGNIPGNLEPDNNFDIEKEDEEMQKAIYQSFSSASNLERSSSRSENTSDEIDRNMEYEVGQEVECKHMDGEYLPCKLISFENDKWTVAWDDDITTDLEHVEAHLRPQSLTDEFKIGDQVLRRGQKCTIVEIDWKEDPPKYCVKVNDTEREVWTGISFLTKVVTASTQDRAIHQVEELPQKANVSNNDQATTLTQEEGDCDGCGCCIENTPHVATYTLQEEGTNNDQAATSTPSANVQTEPLQSMLVVTYTSSSTVKETTSRISTTTISCIIIGVAFLCVIISLIIAIVLHKHKQAANYSQASKKPLPNKDLSKTEEKELSSIHLQDTAFDRTALNGLSTIELPSIIDVSENDIDTENVSATATDEDTQAPMAPENIV